MTEYQLCPHGRHYDPEDPSAGAVCEPCREQEENPLDWVWVDGVKERQSGMNASYYDFPCTNAQELIEWLDLDFANANILKSLIRENNPLAKKNTDELYEAEKKYYYALRNLNKANAAYEEAKERYANARSHLRSVQKRWSAGGVDCADVEKKLEEAEGPGGF